MSFNLGDVVPLSVTIKDANDDPANAGAVTLTVTLPDGTTNVTGPITPTSTGVYDHDYPTVQAGRHAIQWAATGANASAYTDAFDVEAADALNFISLADAKQHVRKTGTADDEQLTGFVSAACTMIEDRIGIVAPRNYTDTRQRQWGVVRAIVLTGNPVISITSVQVDGITIPPADEVNNVHGWVLDAAPGVLRHTGHWPHGPVTVTYRAGRTPTPGNIRMAALELVSHLWRTSQLNGSARPALSGEDSLMLRGDAYAFPYRVRELLGLGKLPTTGIQVG